MDTYQIIRLGNDWYDFKLIPQKTYIKTHGLRCISENKAIKRAEKIVKENGLGYCNFEFIKPGEQA